MERSHRKGLTSLQAIAYIARDMVTVETTPRLAEKLAVSQSLGTISLSLRSIADNTADLERAVAEGDVKVPVNANPAEERKMLLAVANRPQDNNTTFVTGGDVSRFQRTSVPQRSGGAPAAAGGAPAAGGAVGVPAGPVVRVARGNSVMVVPVGAR